MPRGGTEKDRDLRALTSDEHELLARLAHFLVRVHSRAALELFALGIKPRLRKGSIHHCLEALLGKDKGGYNNAHRFVHALVNVANCFGSQLLPRSVRRLSGTLADAQITGISGDLWPLVHLLDLLPWPRIQQFPCTDC